jgi:hypothetical protein
VKIDLPDEYVQLIITALETQYAYTRAKQADDARYQEATDWFKRKRPGAEEPVAAKRTGTRRRS